MADIDVREAWENFKSISEGGDFRYGEAPARRPPRAARYAATAVAAIAIVLGVAMISPDVRAAVYGLVRARLPDHTSYEIAGQEAASPGVWSVGWVPEGFALSEAHAGDIATWLYDGADGVSIVVTIVGKNGKLSMDNEHSDMTQGRVNGNAADIYTSNTEGYPSHVVIYAERESAIISVVSELDVAELLRVAQSVARDGGTP
ncbi:MAG: DUF4367 domain-containing protein [Oscillospiraceae bacterium]|nr:DUF4367 domain-containing protein [Oscillospiraceae bacterium]